MKIIIGTPTSRGQVWAEHTRSVAWAAAYLTAHKVGFDYFTFSWYDVAQQRDRIAHEFLKSDATHLLFVDSDVGFHGELPLRLLRTGKPLIGAVCARRFFDYDEAQKLIEKGHSIRDAMALCYRLAFESSEQFEVVGGVAKVNAVGAGILLIARECFEKINEHFSPRKYRLSSGNLLLTEFFPWGREGEEIYPEDWGFCRKWRDIGGEVFAYFDADTSHFGEYAFNANFRKIVEAQMTVREK